MCEEAGVRNTSIAPIEVETIFPDFEAFWHPFTLGEGPAPGYCKNLSDDKRQKLKDRLSEKFGAKGIVVLPARAWAVKPSCPD